MIKYKMKKDRVIRDTLFAKAGDTVYSLSGYDYGLANDDSRGLGIPHTSVTLKENGDYPCFTVPTADLEKVNV